MHADTHPNRSHPTAPALLAIAHGSRDPRHAAALRTLLDAVRHAHPALHAELGFLSLCGPDVPDALAHLTAAGAEHVTVVPFFLNHGYHVQHDIPDVTDRALHALRHPPTLTIAAPLGPDALLTDAIARRLIERGLHPHDPALHVAVASATAPPVADTINALRNQGATRIAVAAHFLAPGLLYDQARTQATQAHVPITTPLATPHHPPPPELTHLILARYTQATTRQPTLAAA